VKVPDTPTEESDNYSNEAGSQDGGNGFDYQADDNDVAIVGESMNKNNSVKFKGSKGGSSANNNAGSAEYDFLDHLLSPSKETEKDKSKRRRRGQDDDDDIDEGRNERGAQSKRNSDDEYADEDGEDQYDRHGVAENEDGDEHLEPEPEAELPSNDPRSLLKHHWNLELHLPPMVAEYFRELIGRHPVLVTRYGMSS
jgi:hypothetical protein